MRGTDEAEADDGTLAARAAAGDAAAFARLLERHYDRIHRIGWRLLGTAAEADDLAQDVCLGLATRVRGYRGEAAFTTWLYRVVLNAARDRLRGQGRAAALGRAWTEADALARAGAEARAREADWLREALDGLAAPLRETVVLVLDEGLSHAEAGAVLGISGGTVSWRMAEVRKALRARAEEDMTR